MAPGLSYPGFRCVFEYLEPIKRLHITNRSPALQKVEKSIPLHLEKVQMGLTTLAINNRGANVCMEKKKKLMDYYLRGRPIIYVDQLTILCKFSNLGLGFLNLCFRVNNLNTDKHDFQQYLSIIDPINPQLRILITGVSGPEIFDHPAVQLCQEPIFMLNSKSYSIQPSDLDKVNSKNVKIVLLSQLGVMMNIVELIRLWMTTKKEIGTKYKFSEDRIGVVKNAMRELKQHLEEFENESYSDGEPSFTIPSTRDSEIFVHGRNVEQTLEEYGYELVVEVIQTDLEMDFS